MLKSFDLASAKTAKRLELKLTPASAAGLLLELFGSARVAFDVCLQFPTMPFWFRTSRLLFDVACGEMKPERHNNVTLDAMAYSALRQVAVVAGPARPKRRSV